MRIDESNTKFSEYINTKPTHHSFKVADASMKNVNSVHHDKEKGLHFRQLEAPAYEDILD